METANNPPKNTFTAKIVRKVLSPIERFMHLEASSGILLVIVTIIALFWANSAWHESYEHFIHTQMGLQIGHWNLTKSLHHWVNDGLMAIFFFVVGMEIKRELVKGELSSPRRAALPLFAALGGMLVPALIYALFNIGTDNISGWGIPMATDIAFAVGILALMSKRVPFAAKVFLLALAIVDDLGAVLVIALFYTEQISHQSLIIATVCLGLIYFFHISGIYKELIYIALGTLVWFFVLKSGVHATVAGVILGFLVPLSSQYTQRTSRRMKELVDNIDEEVERVYANKKATLTETTHSEIHELHHMVSGITSPLDKTIHKLHPWVSFVIMPTFALVNAGVNLGEIQFSELLSHPVSLGVTLGLVLGKPLGITLFSWLACKIGLASLPNKVTWHHIIATGFLGGIGFTMALFISNLALSDPKADIMSKLGILTASLLAGILGSTYLIVSSKVATPSPQPKKEGV